MNNSRKPTITEIDQLTAYLPILYADGFNPVKVWYGGRQKDETIQMPYPEYDEVVTDFFHLVAKDYWMDYEYVPENARQSLENEEAIKSASLGEIKTMLTYCVRGERFCVGHWESMIVNGYVRRILERLIDLRQQMGENTEV
jgi:hypothetical protein